MLRLLLTTFVLTSIGLTVHANDAETPTLTADEVAEQVRLLGDDDFFVREGATRRLWESGPDVARAALEKARNSGDREVVFRAERILWNFDHGILVGTPPEVIRLVGRFQTNNDSVKREVVRELARLGQIRTLTALLRNTSEQAKRGVLAQQVASSVSTVLPRLLAEDRHDETLDWLDLAAEVAGAPAVRNRDAFLLVHGGLAERIATTEQSFDPKEPSKSLARELVRMHLAAGNVAVTTKYLDAADDKGLVQEVALRSGDWATLAEEAWVPGDPGYEQLGFRAVFARLAGDDTGLEKAAGELQKHANEHPERRWVSAEALLLAERTDDAVEVFRGLPSSLAAFELECARGRYRRAFADLGVALNPAEAAEADPPLRTVEKWFDDEVAAAGGNPNKLQAAVARGIVVLREVVRARGRKAGTPLLERIRRVAENPQVARQYSVVQVAGEIGDRSVAFEVATELLLKLKEDGDPRILGPLFDDREATVFALWWSRRRRVIEERLDESAVESLEWADDVLGGRSPDDELAAICESLANFGERQQDSAVRLRWIKAAAEIAYDRGEYELAAKCFAPVVAGSAGSTQLVFAGDVEAKAKDWTGGARFYERAAEANRADVLAPMLHWLALVEAGQVEQGKKLVARSRLLPLGNLGLRSTRASDLVDRGFVEEAKRDWEIVLRIGSQSEFEGENAWAVQLTFARFGNALSDDEPLRAADYWQQYLVHFVKTNSAYTEVRRYLAVGHLARRVRARGLVQAGRIEEAMDEARRAHAVWPGNIELALRLVPVLEEKEHEREADAVFDLVHADALRRAEDFPENAGAQNDLAWLNAKCSRRLDEALKHARQAVAAEPDSVAYLDTLAEVHFQRGDRDEAVALAERCVAMDPRGEHYRDQLKRFRAE